jgi:hypothetical protein
VYAGRPVRTASVIDASGLGGIVVVAVCVGLDEHATRRRTTTLGLID